MKMGAELTHDDVPSSDGLTRIFLDASALSMAVTTVT